MVVAKSGGDFDSIQTAIDSINPTAENPYLIKVMPGTYNEQVILKSYINLQGAGSNVTTINVPGMGWVEALTFNGINDVIVSGFTVTNGSCGIYINQCSSITISGNMIKGNIGWGVEILYSSSVKITENTIKQQRGGGIITAGTTSSIIGNTIIENMMGGIQLLYNSPAVVTGNVMSDANDIGILVRGSSPIITNNKITGYTPDIAVASDSSPIISFNIYDTGWAGGIYNVKSDGTPVPTSLP